MPKHPAYRAGEVAGRRLWWEEIPAGLKHYHLRLYYPDCCGNLRLVFTNDGAGNNKCAIDAHTMRQEFGVTCRDPGVSESDTQLREYEKLQGLDPLCAWPRRL